MGLLGRSGTAPGNNNMYTIVFYIYDSIAVNKVHQGAAAAFCSS
jgi:hypothetical protein